MCTWILSSQESLGGTLGLHTTILNACFAMANIGLRQTRTLNCKWERSTHPKKEILRIEVRFVNTRQPITTLWVKQWWIYCQRHRGFWRYTSATDTSENTYPNIWDIGNIKQNKRKRTKILKRSVGNGIFQTKDCFKSSLRTLRFSICTYSL